METKNGERDLQKALNASNGAEMESLQVVAHGEKIAARGNDGSSRF